MNHAIQQLIDEANDIIKNTNDEQRLPLVTNALLKAIDCRLAALSLQAEEVLTQIALKQHPSESSADS